jgi:hypothetical protein
VANQLVTAQIMIFRTGKIKGGCHDIVDPSAADAAQVIVLRLIGVEAGLAARVFEFLDQAHPEQQVKVSVDGAQADFRQSRLDELEELHGGRVGSDRLQFLQNHLPLPRFAALPFRLTIHTENYY